MNTDKVKVMNLSEWKVKVKYFDIISGSNIVILNEEEANLRGVFPNYRVELTKGNNSLIAVADLSRDLVSGDEIGVFNEVAKQLKLKEGDIISIKHLQRPLSLNYIKKKMDGNSLKKKEIYQIIDDLMLNCLSQAELSAFITSVYIRGMTDDEVVFLTQATVDSGDTLDIGKHPIVDKHCTGGINGRATMIIVPILASAGLWIPKTSSRSITSAAGTADSMELFCPVDIKIDEFKQIVLKTHGAIVWGGGINLASADDKLIKIRHPFSLDPKGVLLASILAKKKAVNSDYLVIDMPVGRGAKIQDTKIAKNLAKDFVDISLRLGIHTQVMITDGSDPIGNGIGPSLEAMDVLNILAGQGPRDLKNKSCLLAGKILEMTKTVKPGKGFDHAMKIINSGKAMSKFREIIEAQGGDGNVKVSDLPLGSCRYEVIAERSGRVSHVDNKIMSRLARAAGAPVHKGAGIMLHCEKGDKVHKGDVLFDLYAESETNLDYALKAYEKGWKPIELQKIVLDMIK